jgi:hypothetical protein
MPGRWPRVASANVTHGGARIPDATVILGRADPRPSPRRGARLLSGGMTRAVLPMHVRRHGINQRGPRMAELALRIPDGADEPRPFVEAGRVAVPRMSGGTLARGVIEPGWRWSEHVKQIAGTNSCQSLQVAYCVSCRIAVRMDDGTEMEIRPGDVVVIPPGHDA